MHRKYVVSENGAKYFIQSVKLDTVKYSCRTIKALNQTSVYATVYYLLLLPTTIN